MLVLLIGCLMICQAFADEYIGLDLPMPNEYLASWGGFSGNSGAYVSSGIPTPVITADPSPYIGVRGEVPYTLRVEASSYDGMLCYQWYMSYTGTYNDLYPIEGAWSSSYTPNQILGTSYYCVGVYNVNGELRSEEVYSSIVPVAYSGILITCPPYKLSYTVGSAVDLSGLVVNVFDGYSSSWQSFDGAGLNVYPSVFTNVGKVAVEVSYNGSSDVFYVNVGTGTGAAKTSTDSGDGTGNVTTEDGQVVASDGSHVHSFGEWEVTKPATCVTTGLETRTCECGETETQDIPRTDHAWDEGVVTKEATETSNGARLYTCTVCKANKSEIIPAGTGATSHDKQMESLNINGGDPQETGSTTKNASVTGKVDTATTGANEKANVAAGNVNNNNNSSGWWLIPVSALVLVGTGTGAYYVMRKKGSQQ